ncbi:oligosaccharide flippase family protein, partial [Candidatus Saccharibacteria bacterium]|nr:oligosaccharide flippase family protein [Candidatus Saccharibacteria bacterium]
MKNGFWIISERIISTGITVAITLIAARYLGAVNYGILSYGLTLATIFTGLMKLGIDSIIVNELINNSQKQGSLLGTSIILRVVSSIFSILSIGLIAYALNSNDEVLVLVSVVQALILLFQAIHILDYWFQSQLKSKYVSIAKIVATAISAIYSIYILVIVESVVWFAASTMLAALVIALLLYVFYRMQGGDRLSWSWTDGQYILAKSYHFIIANVIAMMYVQIDKLMVGSMIGIAELGVYSAALLFCTAWVFLPDSIITSMRPSILSARLKSSSLYLRRLKQLYFVIF